MGMMDRDYVHEKWKRDREGGNKSNNFNEITPKKKYTSYKVRHEKKVTWKDWLLLFSLIINFILIKNLM